VAACRTTRDDCGGGTCHRQIGDVRKQPKAARSARGAVGDYKLKKNFSDRGFSIV
jgi:hypothetical protein